MRKTRMPESVCPYCRKTLNGAASLDLASPSSGDLTVCFGCARFLQFDKNLMLAKVEESEIDQIKQKEPELYAELERFKLAIQQKNEGGDRNG